MMQHRREIARSSNALDHAERLAQEVERELRARFPRRSRTPLPQDLTVGIEHELFLAEPSGIPASHERSQQLLSLAAARLEYVVHTKRDELLGDFADSAVAPGARWPAIKFEHPPHLLEVALAPATSVVELADDLEKCLAAIDSAAKIVGLKVWHEAFARHSASEPRILESDALRAKLRRYREVWRSRAGAPDDDELLGFSGTLAATQVHVGGIDPFESPELIEALYGLEPRLLGLTFMNTRGSSSVVERIRGRYGRYRACLPGAPLVGFPALSSWTPLTWAAALVRMPMLGLSRAEWAGIPALELPEVDPATVLLEARDLQIVRPREYGTLEMRADPAQMDARSILALAALRIGAVSLVLEGRAPRTSWSAARQEWWARVEGGNASIDHELGFAIGDALARRGYGEEALLEPFRAGAQHDHRP